MTKQELRKIYFQKRLALTDREYEQMSAKLCESFFAHVDLSGVRILHIFLPIKKNREPDTWLIIDRIKKEHPGIRITVPKITDTGAMESYFLEENNLALSTWGIPEPKGGTLTDPAAIDLVVVPLLVVDKKGHRIGYGKGFYDRFLPQCSGNGKRIGLSFFDPIDEISGLFEHDLPLHGCVLTNGWLKY